MNEKEFNEVLQQLEFQREIENQLINEKYKKANIANNIQSTIAYNNLIHNNRRLEHQQEAEIMTNYRVVGISINIDSEELSAEEISIQISHLRSNTIRKLIELREEIFRREINFIDSLENNNFLNTSSTENHLSGQSDAVLLEDDLPFAINSYLGGVS